MGDLRCYRLTVNEIDFITFTERAGGLLEIVDIAVMSDRTKGHGRRLVDDMLAVAQANWPNTKLVYAMTRVSNDSAHAFYAALGFRKLGTLSKLYEGSEECLVMGLDVPEFKTRKNPRKGQP